MFQAQQLRTELAVSKTDAAAQDNESQERFEKLQRELVQSDSRLQQTIEAVNQSAAVSSDKEAEIAELRSEIGQLKVNLDESTQLEEQNLSAMQQVSPIADF